MKMLYLALSLLVTSCTAVAQPKIKIYAYSQETMPGTIPVDEEGNPRKIAPNINYLIFASHPPSYSIKFDGIWIKGQGYSVQTSVVGSTPVTVTNYEIPSKPETTILVPATKQKVMAIVTVQPVPIKVNAAWFRDMLRKNELIVSYFYKGKKYFTPVRKIKVLPPVMAM